jgi:hypothetical protein
MVTADGSSAGGHVAVTVTQETKVIGSCYIREKLTDTRDGHFIRSSVFNCSACVSCEFIPVNHFMAALFTYILNKHVTDFC